MKFKKNISFIFLILFAINSFYSLTIPDLTGPVIDKANLLSNEQFTDLDVQLRAISQKTGTQIVVLTIPSLEGLDIESYTMSVAEKWKIGSRENDDGVILCIAFAEKKIRIETGYGVEGLLTDTKCGLIIRNVLAPNFQAGKYGKGIIEAVNAIESMLGLSDVSVDYSIEDEPVETAPLPIIIFFFLFYVFMITGALSTKFPWLRWLPWAMLFKKDNSRGRYRSSHDDFFGGFGGGSSGGGSGFSGGGGSFGGGGASGGW